MKNSNMASLYGISFTILLVLLATTMYGQVVSAKEFKVGDAVGWSEPRNNHTSFYKEWASKAKFHVGDSLRFEYNHDSVLVVEKYAYYHCNISKPISTFKNGDTLYKLNKPGSIFFISGAKNHCDNGQRLVIDVANTTSPSRPNAPPRKNSGEKSVSAYLFSVCLALVATSMTI